MTIHSDGRIVVRPDGQPDETAKEVLKLMERYLTSMLEQAVRYGYQNSGSLIREYTVVQNFFREMRELNNE